MCEYSFMGENIFRILLDPAIKVLTYRVYCLTTSFFFSFFFPLLQRLWGENDY